MSTSDNNAISELDPTAKYFLQMLNSNSTLMDANNATIPPIENLADLPLVLPLLPDHPDLPALYDLPWTQDWLDVVNDSEHFVFGIYLQ